MYSASNLMAIRAAVADCFCAALESPGSPVDLELVNSLRDELA